MAYIIAIMSNVASTHVMTNNCFVHRAKKKKKNNNKYNRTSNSAHVEEEPGCVGSQALCQDEVMDSSQTGSCVSSCQLLEKRNGKINSYQRARDRGGRNCYCIIMKCREKKECRVRIFTASSWRKKKK